MLSLAILRHAKSSWGDHSLDDFDRPLNERGQSAALVMGRVIRDAAIPTRLVLCSGARRTRETLGLALPFLAADRIEFDDKLYLASASLLLARLRAVPQDKQGAPDSILLIGHNPGLADLATELTGSGDDDDIERLHAKFPTGALAHITFTVTAWRDLRPGSGNLGLFAKPKECA